MAGFRVSIEGLKQLDQALAELPKATGKAVLRRTLIKAGEPLADDMRARRPTIRKPAATICEAP
ncbi:hypothetical protein [Sinorhizobium meliloti]|uniref:hypothetical protein n=1 Tax=Rhizobium meliloti TaxID=382 RepID=UPI00238063BB|nr:hypothetical protein [Sinorhizobium meliloti]